MSSRKRKPPVAVKELESGQIWRMADAKLHVEAVGRLLVHYKLYRDDAKRTHTSLSAKRVVTEYLKDNKAVLVR